MRKLAYLLLSLIITVCVLREVAYNLEIQQPRAEGWLAMLYDWAFYGTGDLYNILNYAGVIGSLISIGVLRQVGSLDVGRIDAASLDVPHVTSDVEAFKIAFPKAEIKKETET